MNDNIIEKLISAFEIALLKFDEMHMGSEAKKKDRRIRDLEAQVKAKKEKARKLKESCLCKQRLERQNSTLYHRLKSKKQKDNIHSIVRQFVTAGSGNNDAEAKENEEQEAWLSFLSDCVGRGSYSRVLLCLNKVMSSKNVAKVLKIRIQKNKRKASREITNKVKEYIADKKNFSGKRDLSRNKKSSILGGKKFELVDGVDVSPVKGQRSSYSDAKCRQFLVTNCPLTFKVKAEEKEGIMCDNAFIKLKDLVKALVEMIFALLHYTSTRYGP